MKQSCRLFIGVGVPSAFVQWQNQCKRRVESFIPQSNAQIHWVPEQNLHMTILFIGTVGQEAVSQIAHTLSHVYVGMSPFRMLPLDIRILNSNTQKSVLCVAFRPDDAYRELVVRTKHAVIPFWQSTKDREKEVYASKIFPHVTLARVTPEVVLPKALLTGGDVQKALINVTHVNVYSSDMSKLPPVYTCVSTTTLTSNIVV